MAPRSQANHPGPAKGRTPKVGYCVLVHGVPRQTLLVGRDIPGVGIMYEGGDFLQQGQIDTQVLTCVGVAVFLVSLARIKCWSHLSVHVHQSRLCSCSGTGNWRI